MRIRAEFDVSDLLAKDDTLVSALNDMTPAMNDVGQFLAETIEKNFASESAAGDAWAPLTQSTIRDRARKGFGSGPILERTGSLKRAATSAREITALTATVGFADGHKYAKFHMSHEPRTKLPLRDAVIMNDKHADQIENIVAAFLKRNAG